MTSAVTAPTPQSADAAPLPRRTLFVTLPVADVQRSVHFFEALGFSIDPALTGPHGACLRVTDDASCMLVTRAFFEQQAAQPLPPPAAAPTFALAFSVPARADVDTLVERALALGATPSGTVDDHGFMYQRGFRDLDGYHWDPFWAEAPPAAG